MEKGIDGVFLARRNAKKSLRVEGDFEVLQKPEVPTPVDEEITEKAAAEIKKPSIPINFAKSEPKHHAIAHQHRVKKAIPDSGAELMDQITDIESQLKQAQTAFEEIQAIKNRLEKEKKEKDELDIKKQELSELVTENRQLKSELAQYESEIYALKTTITSLKDDLVQSVDKFQHKIDESVQSLKNGEVKKPVEQQPVSRTERPPYIPPVRPTVVPEKPTQPVVTPSEATPAKQAPEQAAPVVQPEAKAPDVPVVPPPSPEPAIVQEDAEVEDNEHISAMEKAISEYEKIKKELEALENDKDEAPIVTPIVQPAPVDNSTPPAPVATPDAAPVVAQSPPAVAVAPTEEKKDRKKAPFFFFFKKKVKKTNSEKPAITPPQEKSEDSKKNDKKGGKGKLLAKAAIFILILSCGYTVLRIRNAEKLRSTYISQVKGISTSKPSTDLVDGLPKSALPIDMSKEPYSERFKEAFVDLPFEKTTWGIYNDADLGIKIKYPQNTSNQNRPYPSNSVWFLRKNGYLMKIERIDDYNSVNAYLKANPPQIDYLKKKAKLNGLTATHLIQNEYMDIRGNIYLIKTKGVIYKIWYRTYVAGENPSDEKRVAKMLKTLEFIPRTPI